MSDPDRRAAMAALVREALRPLQAYSVPRPPAVRAKLDANELPFELPGDVAAALGAELGEVPLNRYPAADCAALRACIAGQLGVPGDTLCFGNGSDELIAMILSTFSEPRPGRARAVAMYPGPTFSVYGLASVWAGVDPLEVPLTDRFELDGAAFEAAVERERPNVVFFARPNNPTGTLWSRHAVLRIAELFPDVLVVHDEAYGDYGGDSMVDQVPHLANLVVLRTLSKVGLAALRIGYLYADPAIVHEVDKLRPPYNIGALNQRAAVWLLENHADLLRDRCSEIVAARERLHAALSEMRGVEPFESRANLILFRVGEPGDGRATQVWRALASRGVLVRNLDAPGPLAGCLRLTVGTADENDLFLATLAEVMQ
ncbi:MAG TPA: histidinol-phosphate transaminase [Kofleriaceae bacterium]|nr:histidinol-phosphate transaminase [Kofleriaceae bacterium]